MAIKTTATSCDLTLAFEAAVSSNTTTNTAIVDTADYDFGLTWFVGATAYTDGTYQLVFQEGDASDLSDAVTVDSAKIVVGAVDPVATGVTAVTADGANLLKAGVFSNKRYVRAQIVSTGVTTGATLSVFCLKSGEVLPQNV